MPRKRHRQLGSPGLRGRQQIAAVFVVAAAVVLATQGDWPFSGKPHPVSDYAHPTIWQLLFSDRITLGLLRLSLVGLGFFVVVSIPALVVAGRWLKGFGTGGLTADDAQDAQKQIADMKKNLDDAKTQLDVAKSRVSTLTQERDQAIALAEAHGAPKRPPSAAGRRRRPSS